MSLFKPVCFWQRKQEQETICTWRMSLVEHVYQYDRIPLYFPDIKKDPIGYLGWEPVGPMSTLSAQI